MSNSGERILIRRFDKMTEKNLRSLVERVMREGSLKARDDDERTLFRYFEGDHRAFIKYALQYIKDNYGSEKAKAAMRNRLAHYSLNSRKNNVFNQMRKILSDPDISEYKKEYYRRTWMKILKGNTLKIADSAKIAREG